eukprot:TRINITY_DN49365_c0_g1_i1.p1 TRINITY_DN49365_c0_g1~~TRINITY_DN49365_c0_g1_i1.p1  ORF type:complete len:347 (+),score=48.80 TRINITY_DN49365_c0_g1_i1:112-1152(+)
MMIDLARSLQSLASRKRPLCVALATGFWMICSIGMLVFNKLAIHAFPRPCLLVALQMAFSALVMLVFCWSSLRFGSVWDVVRWSSVIPFFVGMLLTSMFALKAAPMSLVITFRALSPVFTLVAEMFYPNPTKLTLWSTWPLAVILLGAVFYTLDMDRSTVSFSAIGWVLLNCMFSICDRLLQRLFLSEDQSPVDISKTGVTLVNNMLGIVPLLCLAFFMGEFEDLPRVVGTFGHSDVFLITTSCIVGVSISYSGILVQSMISATSFLVLINGNKFFVIVLEVFVIRGNGKLSKLQVLGAMLTVFGSLLWSRPNDPGSGAKTGESAETNGRVADLEKGSKGIHVKGL